QGVGEIKTISVNAQMVTSAKQPTDTVYDLTRAMYSEASRKMLDNGHAKGKQITAENAVKGAGIPFHPGAEKYYKEIGLLK
ncbi:MAG: immunogenic protein, partial [Alcaligenaceae bacterium]